MTDRLRLLIVDDNSRMRRTIREVVSPLGPVVEECSDGDEVLARYEAFEPDFVLMDLRMARVDGIAAAISLLAVHPRARLPPDEPGRCWHRGRSRARSRRRA